MIFFLCIREMMQDPLLTKYSVVIVDDVHERTVYTDLIMGLLKKIRRKRPDLKIVISSATIDAENFANFFADEKYGFVSKIIQVQGRMFPVDIYYLMEPCKNYITKAAELALDIHAKKPDGDILVFLTGQEEISTFIDMVNTLASGYKTSQKLFCMPLFGGMPVESQMDVFNKAPYNTSKEIFVMLIIGKLIVATNIAESSVTIDGIVYVVDSCYVKLKYYDYNKGIVFYYLIFLGIESLVVTPVSKASANQRAGRAGRVKCKP
jgi:ATP-dependent RNA helicase DDX35